MHKNYVFLIVALLVTNVAALDTVVLQTEAKPLVASSEQDFMDPCWSPDGTKLAFTTARYQGIWTSDADGSNIVVVTDDPTSGFGFSWAPDSKSILARVAKFQNRRRYNAIKVFELTTKSEKLLCDFKTGSMGLPSWSGETGQVQYEFNKKIMKIDTGLKTAIQGRSLTQGTEKMYLENSKQKRMEQINPRPGKTCLNSVLSPDQKKLAFEELGGNMFVLDLQTKELTDLGVGYSPQWSPDSRHLVYMISKDDGHLLTESEIYISSVDGTVKYQLTDTNDKIELNPAWSPDGKNIAFDEDGVIYMISNMDELIK